MRPRLTELSIGILALEENELTFSLVYSMDYRRLEPNEREARTSGSKEIQCSIITHAYSGKVESKCVFPLTVVPRTIIQKYNTGTGVWGIDN